MESSHTGRTRDQSRHHQKETFVFSILNGLSFLNFSFGNLLPLTDFLKIAS